jgi:hypothetical protein
MIQIRRTRLIALATLLVLVNILLVGIPGCSGPSTPTFTLPPGTDLSFQTIFDSGSFDISNDIVDNAHIVVISSNQTLPVEAFNWIRPEYQSRILEVDYSKYFVVMVFNGYRISIYSMINIQQIRADAGTIFVLAHFNDSYPNATSSQLSFPISGC